MSRKRVRAEDIHYWLLKSEPHKFSIDDLAKQKTSPWDGVRNYAARNNMCAMSVGDKVLFYHSNTKEPGVAGLAEVVRLAYDDFTALEKTSEYFDPKATKEKNPWKMVDVKFVAKWDTVLTLHELKSRRELQKMALFTQSRLSVQPVSASEYAYILRMNEEQQRKQGMRQDHRCPCDGRPTGWTDQGNKRQKRKKTAKRLSLLRQ
ncbi:conserved hypothetical protein [Leishmania infantum JPCM5]|uniref:Thymocyte nuclear protein 1 n=2 Tax=Leishmania infantum TaxID=5671 RepID=A0A6L0Y367_LEIIN|nr:conserved hypothetical protein [Leishmania infantum JPCM5]CAC9553519.1 EVE_domain_containing_protein_-_putative [Leishmania infantum]CAM72504.1 conserved hypothetical protein [Leishmania infantum JPCM5]SUZ47111.1 EVE_domain_containing_protein_-_putative [Leishmania infantum]|eukprot:XP_001469397.1 conserved hypothetical protein [Leishmania infantum JPCM5]